MMSMLEQRRLNDLEARVVALEGQLRAMLDRQQTPKTEASNERAGSIAGAIKQVFGRG